MPQQVSTSYSSTPFVIGQRPVSLMSQIIAQDGARAAALAPYTVMVQDPTTGLWSPLTSIAGSDGSELPQAIYEGEDDITAAELVAGNVDGVQLLVKGEVNKNVCVLEGSLSWSDEITSQNKTIEAYLRTQGIFVQDTNTVG